MFTTTRSGCSLTHIVYCIIFLLFSLVPYGAEASRLRSSRIYRRQDASSDQPCKDLFDSECKFSDEITRAPLTCSTVEIFVAKDVYHCLQTVPFNQTNALQLLQYWEDTLQLQSTLAYLKDPPPEYQQPKYDLIGALDLIRSEVNTGKFKNEYDFESAIQQVVIAAHDAHITLSYGILSVFVFGSPYGLVAASKDGIELPKLYVVG